MARFYRTAQARPIDYMHRLNVPLMQDVLKANDAYITQQLGIAGKISELANFDHLLNDDEDANTITKKYEDQVSVLTDAIRKDPANWRKQLPNIEALKQDLLTNYKSGPISKLATNYARRKKDFDAIDKQVELYHTSGGTKGVSPNRAAAYKNYYDSNFDKTIAGEGKYNIYQGGSVMDDIDIKKTLSEGLDKIKSDSSYNYYEDEVGNGWYTNKVTGKVEAVTPDKILEAAVGNVNPQLLNYLREEQKVGLMRGVYDDKGNFVAPFTVGKVPVNEQEQAQLTELERQLHREKDPKIKQKLQSQLNSLQTKYNSREQINWNDSNPLAPILRGLTRQYSWSKTEQGNDLTSSPKGATIYNAGQAWARQTRSLQQKADQFAETQNRLDERMRARFDHDLQMQHLRNQGKSGSGSTTMQPIKTSIDRLATRSFEDMWTKDKNGRDVLAYSVPGLTADIDNIKTKVSSAKQELKDVNAILKDPTHPDYNKALLRKNELEVTLKLAEGDLSSRRQVYAAARERGLATLTPEERKFWEENIKGNDRANELDNEEKLRQEYIRMKKEHPVDVSNQNYQIPVELREAEEKLRKATQIRKKLVNATEDQLKSFRTENIDADAVLLNEQDSNLASEIILNNTRGMKLYDSNGQLAAKRQLDKPGLSLLGDNADMKFAEGDLQDYMELTGTKMIVQRIAPSTRLGNGNTVAEVRFEDPTGEIPKRETFYISLNEDAEQQLSSQFSRNPDQEVSSLAQDWTNPVAKELRRRIINLPVARNTTAVVPGPNGNQIPINVTKAEGGRLIVTATGKDGQQMDFPNFVTGQNPGLFNGINELTRSIEMGMRAYQAYLDKQR